MAKMSGKNRYMRRPAAGAGGIAGGMGAGGGGANPLAAAQEMFAKAQEELKAAAQNTAQIKTELGLVEQQWFFFQNALSLREAADRKKASTDVATTSERILEQMDAVVGLYEKIAREG